MKPTVAYCHVIASLLAADGMMDQPEREFLDATMTKLGLDETERDAVMHFEGGDDAERVVAEMPLEERQELRDDLLAATLADGKISPLESQMMQRLSELLGL